ncbi:cache domain-containing protein [Geobacter sp. AOG2]|uniref:sensor histidine kinase n=1 Tax=Geobacter sp. AOG2 TaxID=1566347 RepID=UPI001CC8224A|nr:cache domain-containing protein [Geobacter sp. AOG2]GFE61799.1 two-component sensor histidine kinase [Geobacter sp. AOG2]
MPRRFPIRAKLTVGALAPLFVAFFICSLTGLYIIDAKITSQAQEKVRTDLNSAREAYHGELRRIGELLELTADNPFAAMSIRSGDRRAISSLLTPLLRKKHLDILTAVDKDGRVLFRAHDPARFGDVPTGVYFIDQALKGNTITGTTILSPEQLAAESEGLTDRARIDVVTTPHSRPPRSLVERSGMIMVSAAPVLDGAGRVIGALYGAELLNNNNDLVDKIKQTVYEGVKFRGQDVGTATLFLGDTRIATNVLASNGRRAIGTQLSEEVYNRVILENRKWVGRAFVVNDWYLTAYEPIVGLRGEVVGSLYVGMLEKQYSALKNNVNSILVAVLFVSSLVGLAVSGIIGTHLANPIKELEQLTRRVTLGERDLRIELRSADELGDLAGEFNQMTRALAQRESEITILNRSLEQKVQKRTAELEEKNALLLDAQADLAKAEKLADLGIIAAGVAHEINNPLAVIRGNIEVMEMCLPPEHANREEVGIISQQVDRIAKIVGNLLAFARQKAHHRGEVPIHGLLDGIIGQIGHQIPMDAVTVVRKYDPNLTVIRGDGDQLRQVFTNLILNAVQAMDNHGTLTLTTRGLAPLEGCEISISDTGRGIKPENLKKIFTPFFTTRAAGSGLGLSISYGIIKDHGGDIKVSSVEGEGTTFRVTIP